MNKKIFFLVAGIGCSDRSGDHQYECRLGETVKTIESAVAGLAQVHLCSFCGCQCEESDITASALKKALGLEHFDQEVLPGLDDCAATAREIALCGYLQYAIGKYCEGDYPQDVLVRVFPAEALSELRTSFEGATVRPGDVYQLGLSPAGDGSVLAELSFDGMELVRTINPLSSTPSTWFSPVIHEDETEPELVEA